MSSARPLLVVLTGRQLAQVSRVSENFRAHGFHLIRHTREIPFVTHHVDPSADPWNRGNYVMEVRSQARLMSNRLSKPYNYREVVLRLTDSRIEPTVPGLHEVIDHDLEVEVNQMNQTKWAELVESLTKE